SIPSQQPCSWHGLLSCCMWSCPDINTNPRPIGTGRYAERAIYPHFQIPSSSKIRGRAVVSSGQSSKGKIGEIYEEGSLPKGGRTKSRSAVTYVLSKEAHEDK